MTLKNQVGIITLDFIFAIVLIFGLTSVLFALAFTLSIVEVVQYISFATARTYFGGHVSKDAQLELATLKYKQLVTDPALRPLFTNGWFQLGEPRIADFTTSYPEQNQDPTSEGDTDTFVGAQIPFTAHILNIRIPFYGSTTGSDDGLVANIGSYLSREPTFEECRAFTDLRWEAIQRAHSSYQVPNAGGNAYVSIMDDGC